MTYNQVKTGKRLKEARKNLGYSLEKVAELCGIQQYQTVSSWENGNSTPSIEKLIKLADLYDCEIGYLIGEYDCKRRTIDSVEKITGLSEKAVESLENDNFFDKDRVNALNELLLFNDGEDGILGLIKSYLYHNYTGPDINIGNNLNINGKTVADTFLLQILSELRALREKVQGGTHNG